MAAPLSQLLLVVVVAWAAWTAGDNGLEYKGKHYHCLRPGGDRDADMVSVNPLLNVRSRADEQERLYQFRVYTASFFRQHFHASPKIRLAEQENESFYYTVMLYFGKNPGKIRYFNVNVPGFTMTPKSKQADYRGLKQWDIRYPSKGEAYYYELRVIKQKRQAILPNNGRVDAEWEYDNNVSPYLCEQFSVLPFWIVGDAAFDADYLPQMANLHGPRVEPVVKVPATRAEKVAAFFSR